MNISENNFEIDDQPLEQRVNNRSQPPKSQAFTHFISSNWAPSNKPAPIRAAVADFAAQRRKAISLQLSLIHI